mmetsp:Transcript_118065/g.306568  ORF Transcript_118065/g.306568 Transcript_118065/m.306568 type:complete len:244 (+) Transcript_118065:1717-2448(+)
MGAAGGLVHERRTHGASLDSELQQPLYVLPAEDRRVLDARHEGPDLRVVPDLALGLPLLLRCEEVPDLLVVDLQVGHRRREHCRVDPILVGEDLYLGEDVLDDARQQPAALARRLAAEHAVRLPAPRLPVGEEAAVVAVQGCILQLLTKLFHERRLACEVFVLWVHRPVGPVELEGSLLPTRRARGHHGRAGRHVHGRTLCPGLLLRVERPHPHADLDEPRAARRRRRARLGQQRRRRSAARL